MEFIWFVVVLMVIVSFGWMPVIVVVLGVYSLILSYWPYSGIAIAGLVGWLWWSAERDKKLW